jgi:deazaflavin-dependent oxidoreductase (nitroreductase family)
MPGSIMPSWMPAFNRAVTNRIVGPFAGRVPPYGAIRHRGRNSGRSYRTPVLALIDGSSLTVPLPYGDEVDWLRNLLAARGGELEFLGRRYAIVNPRVLSEAQARKHSTAARVASRLVKVLVADLEAVDQSLI